MAYPIRPRHYAGRARIRGLEAEARWRRPWGLTIDAGTSTLDDRIQSVTPVPGAIATVTPADALPFAPDFQGDIGVSYAIPLGSEATLTSALQRQLHVTNRVHPRQHPGDLGKTATWSPTGP